MVRVLGSLTVKKKQFFELWKFGTCARLLIGILSTTPNIKLKIKGDKSLNKKRYVKTNKNNE